MRTRLLSVLAVVFLQACGTRPFTPTEYPLRAGLIQTMDVRGNVKIDNGQPSKERVIVYSYGGTMLDSDLNLITAVMVKQAAGELAKNSQPAAAGAAKSIELKVDSLLSEYIAFFWKSKMRFHVKLGNGEVIEMNVAHSSGSLHQDLNGCIADAVVALYKNDKVRAYLAS